jgi:hypothetical protein
MKKKLMLYMLFVCIFVSVSGAYTYTITEYQTLPDLFGSQSMLITGQGGGGDSLPTITVL